MGDAVHWIDQPPSNHPIPLPSQERLRELFQYNAQEGALYWRKRHNSQIDLTKPAGWLNKNGYHGMTVDGVRYRRHRLIWCYFNGPIGALEIDHINGKKGDDRIENLRIATRSQNQYNRPALATNKSGYKGVSRHVHGRWVAWITDKDGRRRRIGSYETAQEAANAYAEAAISLHQDFAHHSILELSA